MRRARGCVPTPHPPGWCIIPHLVREEPRRWTMMRSVCLARGARGQPDGDQFGPRVREDVQIPQQHPQACQRDPTALTEAKAHNCRPPSDLRPALSQKTAFKGAACIHAAAAAFMLTAALPLWAALAARVQHAGERGARHRPLPVRATQPCNARMLVYVVSCLLYAILLYAIPSPSPFPSHPHAHALLGRHIG